jgi:cysteine desulfurase family protein (TIGR01976 family)
LASEPGLRVEQRPLSDRVRTRFPALRDAPGTVFFDNAAGAQVPEEVFDAIQEHLLLRNVQRGGRYERSRAVDTMLAQARERVASFLNAESPREISFGINSTSLIRMIADSMHPLLRAGDEVVVTELDHEANIGPWLRLEASGVKARFWKIRNPGARLETGDLEELLRSGRVRLVAMPLASNATGSVVDVAAASRLARDAGATTFVDAVHFAPHGRIDVRALGADFLAFSGYKIFGPHIGFLWGRLDALRELKPAREFFIPADPPYAFEAGTQAYEGIAGMLGALRYLASLDAEGSLPRAMDRIRSDERGLSEALLTALADVRGLTILGESDPGRAEARVPTVSFAISGFDPARIVEHLASRGIQARDGHLYAPRLLEASGIDLKTGLARVSLCHYNTREEIRKLREALHALR